MINKYTDKKLNRMTLILISVFMFMNICFTVHAAEEVYYSKTDELGTQSYVAFVIDSKLLGSSFSGMVIADPSYDEQGRLKVTSDLYFEIEGDKDGFFLKRPRGEAYEYYSISGSELIRSSEKPETVFVYEETADGHVLAYKDSEDNKTYLKIDQRSLSLSEEIPAEGNVDVYGGSERPTRAPMPRPGELVDEKAPVIIRQMDVLPFVMEGSGYEAPTVSIRARRSDESTSMFFQWYVNGEEYGEVIEVQVDENGEAESTITINELKDLLYGVYPIYCQVYVLEDETKHSVKSYTVNLIVTKGFVKNSLMTFSDLHESWDNIGTALNDIMKENDGKLPSLIVATGDFNSSYIAGYDEERIRKCLDTIVNRIDMQLGDIDTVWVSGNHDNGYAVTSANKEADLGISDDVSDIDKQISGTGIIFDSRSESFRNNAESSQNIEDGLIVIGINYEDLGSDGAYEGSTNGRPDSSKLTYGDEDTDGSVYQYLKKALESISSNYGNELVMISSHAGLHAIGEDEASKSAGARPGNGGADYSIRQSDQIVELLNSYVERLNMDLIFMFGHDHTRREVEILHLPGDIMTVTVSPAVSGQQSQTRDMEIQFTYTSAGYLSDSFNAHRHYSYLTWDKDSLSRELKTAAEQGSNEETDFMVERRPLEEKQEEEKKEEKSEEKIDDVTPIRYYIPPLTGVNVFDQINTIPVRG